jgi:uncharacterized protein YcaQ
MTTPAVDADYLSRDDARDIAVAAQLLDRRPPRPRGDVAWKERLLATIEHLGCVQIDTISVVARSHETVLWSRLGPYDPRLLAVLHAEDRALFEYWAHAAAILPVGAFPYFRRAMAAYRARDLGEGAWAAENQELLDRVLTNVHTRGPIGSRDFDRASGPRPEPWEWWGGKPERRALDHLWSRGDLAVIRREGFQRIFDLTERALPDQLAAPLPTEEEQRRWLVGRSMTALGIATPQWVADYFRTGGRAHVGPREVARELAAMADDGLVRKMVVDGWDEPVWLDVAQMPRLAQLQGTTGTTRAGARATLTTLLSPFDNLVWHRGRTRALFDFGYRLESYTPAAARRYGYYTLPILHRGRLVGRIDPLLDRRARRLTIKAVHLEPAVRPSSRLAAAIVRAINDYASFLQATRIDILVADPPAFLPLLQAAMNQLSLGT